MKTDHIKRSEKRKPLFEPLPKPAVFHEFDWRGRLVEVRR